MVNLIFDTLCIVIFKSTVWLVLMSQNFVKCRFLRLLLKSFENHLSLPKSCVSEKNWLEPYIMTRNYKTPNYKICLHLNFPIWLLKVLLHFYFAVLWSLIILINFVCVHLAFWRRNRIREIFQNKMPAKISCVIVINM